MGIEGIIAAENSGTEPGDATVLVVHIVGHEEANPLLGRGVSVGQESGAVLAIHLLNLLVLVNHRKGYWIESHRKCRVHLKGKALNLFLTSARHFLQNIKTINIKN